MWRVKSINWLIKVFDVDTDGISDGYHTFGELYEHRIALWIAYCNEIENTWHQSRVWKTKKHSDGSEIDGWFVLGMDYLEGYQKTYHLPISYWEECSRFKTLDKAKNYDGHTSKDVLRRLKVSYRTVSSI